MATAPKWKASDAKLLGEIARATVSGDVTNGDPAYLFVTEKQSATLVSMGLIELNNSLTDPNDSNKIAARATTQGLSESGVTGNPVTEAINNRAAAQNMEVEAAMSDTNTGEADAVKVPGKRGRKAGVSYAPVDLSGVVVGQRTGLPDKVKLTRGRKSVYPFETLVAPVQDGEETLYATFFVPGDNARKKLSATVATQNKKARIDPATQQAVVFTAYDGEQDGVKGVLIYRTA